VQRDFEMGVAVFYGCHPFVHLYFYPQLFFNLAPQTFGQRLPRLLLSSRKFPQPAQHPVEWSLSNQEFIVSPDHRRGHIIMGQLFFDRLDR